MKKEASVSQGRQQVESADVFQEASPKAVCRADWDTGEEKIKGERFESASRTNETES